MWCLRPTSDDDDDDVIVMRSDDRNRNKNRADSFASTGYSECYRDEVWLVLPAAQVALLTEAD